jgi:hypothetical protein
MPRHSADILALAKRGAEHRYHELRDELATLVRQFPHLRTLAGRTARASNANGAPTSESNASPHRRRRMSSAARKRISEAQKARWAAQRKAKA